MTVLDQRTLEIVSNCWIKLRHVQTVRELDEDCKSVICALLLRIAADDPTAYEDPELREDLAACSKVGREASGESRVRTGEL